MSKNELASITPADISKKDMFNLINSAQKMKDNVNVKITIAWVNTEEYNHVDKETGETWVKHKTIIISTDKQSYITTSESFFINIQNLLAIYGDPSMWQEEITIKPVTKPYNGKDYLSFEIL